MLSHTFCLEYKNGRFTYEPPVLYSTLAEATMAKKNTSPENDFLLLLFFLERKEDVQAFVTRSMDAPIPRNLLSKYS